MNNPILILAVLCVALAIHYVSQKQLLAKGWKSDDAKPIINRLLINGTTLLVFSIFAFIAKRYPYGLFGILIFIEGAVCFAFARKLSRKK
ncbi:hypothetical protein [Pontiella sp.]|uniref:hypothetical protein n=1 Tax=Pontiella sp. TaxID=2837462 RepID=UPI0035655E42